MFDDDAHPATWRARAVFTVLATLAGVAFGLSTIWTQSPGPLVLIVVAGAAGVYAAFLKRDLPLVVVAVTAALLTSTVTAQLAWSDTVLGFFSGVGYLFFFLVALLLATVLRTRREYVQRGWELAFAEAREHDARVEQTVAREREAMAGEIHDGLGHRLTLIAVQAARLSLDETLPAQARAEMQRIRENAAAASEELGETVRLLSERHSGATTSLSGVGVEEMIERARSSGVTVHGAIEPDLESGLNDFTHAALLRVLQEGLTNAAKHAPGAAVHVTAGIVESDAVLEMCNPMPSTAPAPASTGHGMVALEHRVAILGGILEVERGEVFRVVVRLPAAATPSTPAADPGPSRIGVIHAEAAVAERRHRRAARQAWLVPVAMLVVLGLVAVGYFFFTQFASVLPPERFAAIEVGDSRSETEPLLPLTDMLDAPSSLLPEPSGATCHYYEASASFADRVDVYRICFADDRVVAADTMPSDD